MNEKLDTLTGKLFAFIISAFFLWIVVTIAISGYKHIEEYFSGEQLKNETFKKYSKNMYALLNSRDITKKDIIKMTNHYNRKSDNQFKELGYDVILEDFYVQYLNDNNKSTVFIQNLEDVNGIIDSYKKKPTVK